MQREKLCRTLLVLINAHDLISAPALSKHLTRLNCYKQLRDFPSLERAKRRFVTEGSSQLL